MDKPGKLATYGTHKKKYEIKTQLYTNKHKQRK